MRTLYYTQAVDDALAQSMADDPRIVVFGEDVPLLRRDLLVRFGPKRVRGTSISESAFLGAGVAAAMAGLRPVVELYMADFLGVCMDSLLNHAAKIEAFSGGRWTAPIVIRVPCGGGYGDGGQHEQSLWGWLAHIPGLTVLAPSTPADAGGLMLAALQHNGPVIFFEHKFLSETWLEFLGSGARSTVQFEVPATGTKGAVPHKWEPIHIGKAELHREGSDITIISVGVGVHHALETAQNLEKEGISAGVLDLRTVCPLDKTAIRETVAQTGRLLVVDEDYEGFGLSGEIAAVILEAGISFKYARVCTEKTIPYARHLENQTLPNRERIYKSVQKLME
ncbi:MAG: transketolase C-terminal domain-containing protein [Thermodesulfobacteriota bacterium]|nr:transketolase C-terminal domain-containing protein [Thermodesulfobacteriota bacterium]